MRKLYADLSDTQPSATSLHTSTEALALYPEQDMHSLKNMVEGYCTTQELYSSVANEAYTLVDNKNKSLYNAYTALLADKLGVGMPSLKSISTEFLEGAEGISANHDIALEGFLGNLWEKIKGFFEKIYESIKAFFTKHFTRLGRVKKSLENIKSVLAKTDKAMVPPQELKYTGSLLGRYAGYTTVNESTVAQSLSSVSTLVGAVKNINDAAKTMAEKNLVDKNFFTKIKSLTEASAANSARKEDVDKTTPDVASATISSDKRAERSEKKEKSKKLGDIVKDSDAKASSMQGEVDDKTASDAGSDEANLQEAKKQMTEFMQVIVDGMKASVNDKLVSGKVISKVDVSEKFELEVEMSSDAQAAQSVSPSGKGALVTLVNSALELIVTTEKDVKAYGEVNDAIMKNLDTVDKLIADIDKIDPEKYGKYKGMVNTQVRKRLQLMQKFFSAYNKVGKNVLELSMETCEGTVDYCLLSLKYFK